MNTLDYMYKNLAIIYMNGNTIDDVFELYGIEDVFLYGHCRMAELIICSSGHRVNGIIDQDITKHDSYLSGLGKGDNKEVKIVSAEYAKSNEAPVIITLGKDSLKIREYLISVGISSHRILFFNLMLSVSAQLCQKETNNDWKTYEVSRGTKCLITGTRFGNRGSQAMMLTACSEIIRKYPDAMVFCVLNCVEQEYEKLFSKSKIIFLTDGYGEGATIDELSVELSMIVDAGGYAISSKGTVNATDRSIRYMQIAVNNHIPMYLLPQSYGPLDFSDEKKELLGGLLRALPQIYAREADGMKLLKEMFHLSNVSLYEDLVLTHDIDNKKVFYSDLAYIHRVGSDNNVAIIPNVQNYNYGDRNRVINIYRKIIKWLIEKEKNIYIIATSEDKTQAWDIYEEFGNIDSVKLVRDILDVREFCDLLTQFQYVISSRYHATVLCYKNGIPCLIIGWAVKYLRLAELFGQEDYAFDVTDEIEDKSVLEALEQLNSNTSREKKQIAEHYKIIHDDNADKSFF